MKNKRYALAVLLVFASLVAFAQYPQPQRWPPDITPKSFPPDIVAPSSELRSQNAPRPLAPEAVKSAIENELHRRTDIVSSNINVNVTKHAVVLYGSVPSAHDDNVAKGIAESHAGKRRVEDNLQIRPPQ